MARRSVVKTFIALGLIGSLPFTANSQQGMLTAQQIAELLNAHNAYRRQVGVPDLTWSTKMAQLANEWVQQGLKNLQCKNISKLDHRRDNPFGENIAYKGQYPKLEWSFKGLVDEWGAEKPNYNPATGKCQGGVCGHYTQVVWHSTREVGCGFVFCTDKDEVEPWQRVSLVCNYDPAGNSGGLAYPQWVERPVAGRDVLPSIDIGVGANGWVWKTGGHSVGGGNQILYWDQKFQGWAGGHSGGAVRLAVAPNGIPWVVNDSGTTFYANDLSLTSWTQVDGAATDIGVGADGSVWKVGGDRASLGGYHIYRWNKGNNNWDRTSGAAVRITFAPNGIPWVVNDSGTIFYANDAQATSWTQVDGAATDIGVGADGTVWITGAKKSAGGHEIRRWYGTDWATIAGGGVNIAVNPAGWPWIVNSFENAFEYTLNPSGNR